MGVEQGRVGELGVVDGLYVLHEVLGEGSIGAVYRATNRLSGEAVALKLLRSWKDARERDGGSEDEDAAVEGEPTPPSQSQDQLPPRRSSSSLAARLSFAREFRTLASLHHPNVVHVLNYGFDASKGPYFTMELMASPRTILAAAEPKPIEGKVDLLVQLLRAISYLHRRNVIHRDLKPNNILTLGDQVKVVDFGIALTKKREDTLIAGTFGYTAPEVFLGQEPVIASDLFSVGVIAYQMFSGQFPYGDIRNAWTFLSRFFGMKMDETMDASLARILRPLLRGADSEGGEEEASSWRPSPLEGLGRFTEPLNDTIRKLLARNPDERHASAEDVIRELGRTLGRELATETSETRESFLQAAEFVGRDAEMTELTRGLDAACARKGSAWLIGGESGVGKSRLVEELRTLALVKGAQVVRGRAIAERGAQFELWAPLLRMLLVYSDATDEDASVLKAIIPEVETLIGHPVQDAPPAPPIETQRRFFAVVERLLFRYRRPLVVVLEDLQWAGDDSISLLDFVSRIAPRSALLVIGNYRDDESPQLPTMLPQCRTMKLERLTEEVVSELTASILGTSGGSPELVSFLQRQTEGNVFFLVEALRALAEEAAGLDKLEGARLPERIMTGGIEAILHRRLARVPADAYSLLQVAAVAGRQLDLPVLRQVTGASQLDAWLRDCSNAAVLELQRGEWSFAHDKLRERILAELLPERTRQLHHDIAQAIEALHAGSSAKFPILAYHFKRAGNYGRACQFFIQSGNFAARLFSLLDARQYYSEALECFTHLPETDEHRRAKIDVTTQLIGVSWFSQAPKQTVLQIDQAEGALKSIEASRWLPNDHLRVARLCLWGGRGCYAQGAHRLALERYRRGLDLANEVNDIQVATLITSSMGQSLFCQGEFKAARPHLEQALDRLAKAGDWADWCRVSGFLGMSIAAMGEVESALGTIWTAIHRINELKYSTYLGLGYVYLWFVGFVQEDWKGSQQAAREVVKYGSMAQDWVVTYLGLGMLEWSSWWLRQGTEAQDAHHQGIDVYKRVQGCPIEDWFLARDVDAAFLQGDFEEAMRLASLTVARCRESRCLAGESFAQRTWGRALAAQGRHDEAETHLSESIRTAELGGGRLLMARTHLAWAESCRQRGDATAAEEHARIARVLSSPACTTA